MGNPSVEQFLDGLDSQRLEEERQVNDLDGYQEGTNQGLRWTPPRQVPAGDSD